MKNHQRFGAEGENTSLLRKLLLSLNFRKDTLKTGLSNFLFRKKS